MDECDVLIAGAGPAGCVAAITLARGGLTVEIIEHWRKPRFDIGETLVPNAVDLAADLLGPDIADYSYETQGSYTAWGSSTPNRKDHYFTPRGYGLCLDRTRFDNALRDVARAEGVTIRFGTQVRDAQQTSNGAWNVTVIDETGDTALRARCLIDATGRSSALSRLRGLPRQENGNLFAYALTFATDDPEHNDQFSRMESAPFGYWYSNALVSEPGRRTVILLTDHDLPEAWLAREVDGFLSLLKHSEMMRSLLERHDYKAEHRVHGAQACHGHMAGQTCAGLFQVGDAAMSFDPNTARGVSDALQSGQIAGTLILKALASGGHRTDLTAAQIQYGARLRQKRFAYFAEQAHLYRQEDRWPEAPFWQRRQHASMGALVQNRSWRSAI